MYLQAYMKYNSLAIGGREVWLRSHGLVSERFKHFVQSARHIQQQSRAASSDKRRSTNDNTVDVESLGVQLSDWQLNMLRVLLVWTCDLNFLKMKPVRCTVFDTIGIQSQELNEVAMHVDINSHHDLEPSLAGTFDGTLSSICGNKLAIRGKFPENI